MCLCADSVCHQSSAWRGGRCSAAAALAGIFQIICSIFCYCTANIHTFLIWCHFTVSQLKRTIISVALWDGERNGFHKWVHVKFTFLWLFWLNICVFSCLARNNNHTTNQPTIKWKIKNNNSFLRNHYVLTSDCFSGRRCPCMETKSEGEVRLLRALLNQALQVCTKTSVSYIQFLAAVKFCLWWWSLW